MANRRGEPRKKSDPVAIQTKGRVTSEQYRKIGGKKLRMKRR